MLLYIVRHGETDWNQERRMQGEHDTPLNKNGKELARITARALEDVPFDLAISSPLSRALETARILIGDRKIPVLGTPESGRSTGESGTELASGIQSIPLSAARSGCFMSSLFPFRELREARRSGRYASVQGSFTRI